MDYYQLKKQVKNDLLNLVLTQEELDTQANIILEHITGLSLSKLLSSTSIDLNSQQISNLQAIIYERQNNIPLQYVLGYTVFANLRLAISRNVFIPRSDTEALVIQAANYIRNMDYKKLPVLEIGIGSGAISIALLLQFADLHILGCDINAHAIELALNNATIHQVQDRLTLKNNSFEELVTCYEKMSVPLHSINPFPKFLGVVSNPPYISQADFEKLSDEIKLCEPATALIGYDNDGLGFYRILAQRVQYALAYDNSFIVLEIGDTQDELVTQIFKANKWRDIHIYSDINGLARVLTALKPI